MKNLLSFDELNSLNESVAGAVVVLAAFGAVISAMTKLSFNLAKQVQTNKLLKNEKDPKKVEKLKKELKNETYVEVSIRHDIRRNKKKLSDAKKKAKDSIKDDEKIMKLHNKMEKLKAKIKMLEQAKRDATAERMEYKKYIPKTKSGKFRAAIKKYDYSGDWSPE
jgi:predicted  nucleic acid-binding Zn-ribbon protein